MITRAQKDFCLLRNIKVGNSYMLPRFGFTIYESPSYLGESFYMDTNPATRSLDHATVEVIDEIDGFFRLRFDRRKSSDPDFYLTVSEMKLRSAMTLVFLRLTLWLPFTIYNWIKGTEREPEEPKEKKPIFTFGEKDDNGFGHVYQDGKKTDLRMFAMDEWEDERLQSFAEAMAPKIIDDGI